MLQKDTQYVTQYCFRAENRRAGFRPDSIRGNPQIGSPAAARGPILRKVHDARGSTPIENIPTNPAQVKIFPLGAGGAARATKLRTMLNPVSGKPLYVSVFLGP